MSETVGSEPKAAQAATPAKPFEATSKNILGNTGDNLNKLTQSFDRSQHQPFRLDNRGFNKVDSIKDWQKTGAKAGQEDVKMPNWWQKGVNPNRTYQEVATKRRKEFVPDISFDLDGDGQVGNRDLVIAKLFDKD